MPQIPFLRISQSDLNTERKQVEIDETVSVSVSLATGTTPLTLLSSPFAIEAREGDKISFDEKHSQHHLILENLPIHQFSISDRRYNLALKYLDLSFRPDSYQMNMASFPDHCVLKAIKYSSPPGTMAGELINALNKNAVGIIEERYDSMMTGKIPMQRISESRFLLHLAEQISEMLETDHKDVVKKKADLVARLGGSEALTFAGFKDCGSRRLSKNVASDMDTDGWKMFGQFTLRASCVGLPSAMVQVVSVWELCRPLLRYIVQSNNGVDTTMEKWPFRLNEEAESVACMSEYEKALSQSATDISSVQTALRNSKTIVSPESVVRALGMINDRLLTSAEAMTTVNATAISGETMVGQAGEVAGEGRTSFARQSQLPPSERSLRGLRDGTDILTNMQNQLQEMESNSFILSEAEKSTLANSLGEAADALLSPLLLERKGASSLSHDTPLPSIELSDWTTPK